jgi:hypothetical protein
VNPVFSVVKITYGKFINKIQQDGMVKSDAGAAEEGNYHRL